MCVYTSERGGESKSAYMREKHMVGKVGAQREKKKLASNSLISADYIFPSRR